MEKMKPKQVIENIKKLKEIAIKFREFTVKPQNDVSVVVGEDRLYLNDEMLQSLDHAINCVGAIEQIKWERDIAISQLNELGYQFGEKIGSDEE